MSMLSLKHIQVFSVTAIARSAPAKLIAIPPINLLDLIDPKQCYALIRFLRWGETVTCPKCGSHYVIKRGFDDTQANRQRYQCKSCQTRFDDLSDTIFAGHHQPLGVWILCLYLMGLNLSNRQIAIVT